MIGKYFMIQGKEDSIFHNIYFVDGMQEGTYSMWLAGSIYRAQPSLHLREYHSKEEFQNMIDSGMIYEIDPPTFFIVTKRDTYSIKEDLKKDGASWDLTNKFWYYSEKPTNYTVKEVLVFPYTGKKLRLS